MESSSVIPLFLVIGIIIFSARLAGTIAREFEQPRVLGELIVGVLLGPNLLNLLHWGVFHDASLEATITELAELGVLVLMFIVGLEVHLDELAQVGNVAAISGVLGAVVPVILTGGVAFAAGYAFEPALFAGVTLAATSVSISAQVLLELNKLRTKEGNALLATALIDDVIAILMVSLVIAVTTLEGGFDPANLAVTVLQMVAFILIAGALSWYVVPRLVNQISLSPAFSQAYGTAAFALVIMLVYGWGAEELGGVAAITGAFLAGVGLSRTRPRAKQEVQTASRNIAYVFLVPIFFVNVGLSTDLSTLQMDTLPFAAALLFMAVISKVGGVGIGALMGGFDNKEALRVGVCMIARGEVGLIIATIGVTSGIFVQDDPLFASLFLVILLTTVLAPPFVRLVFQSKEELQ